MCCGYEDLSDHDVLRGDSLMQTAVCRVTLLASSPTFSRLENRATRAQAWALHEVLVEQFLASHESAPEEIVLDVDASDVPPHGAQEQRQFHAYYDHHWYLPLCVFCGQAMLACYLRPSQIDGAKHAAAIVKLLIERLDDLVEEVAEFLGLPMALARNWEDLPDPPQTFDPAEAPRPHADTG